MNLRVLVATMLSAAAASLSSAWGQAAHVHSFLPSARSTGIDSPVTFFLAVANSGDSALSGCSIAPERFASTIPTPAFLDVIERDASGALIDGTRFQPFTLDVGQTRHFLVSLQGSRGDADNPFFQTSDVVSYNDRVRIVCTDAASSSIVETTRNAASRMTYLGFADREPPDLISIMATPSGDGVIRIDPATGRGVASVAAVNIGAPADFELTADSIGEVGIRACRSDASGLCLEPRSDVLIFHLDRDETAYFSIVVDDRAGSRIPFAPDVARLNINFQEVTEVDRGAFAATSAALVDSGPALSASQLTGQWRSGNRISDRSLILLSDNRYAVFGIATDAGSISTSLVQTGTYRVVSEGSGFRITGTADAAFGVATPGLDATVRADGLMRFTVGTAVNVYRAALTDSDFPATVSGEFRASSIRQNSGTGGDPALPTLTLSPDGTVTGRFVEDRRLYEDFGVSCGISGSLSGTVELTQCNNPGTHRAFLYPIEDSRDSSKIVAAYLRLESARSTHHIYLFSTDLPE
ncbi:hypothetical protein [Hyphobacterium marinum]|uniref:Uncharacterized protein n=1 Tax=Hyphobacterium marinum TaxID=3116574 RepID=A0ABU7LXB4_9PROT|nr:hypothetical protein [Hyphobacterium sp. Y6023]MEE2565922.1 hypothetical protein [Hyphobacterium sp. Y6023]